MQKHEAMGRTSTRCLPVDGRPRAFAQTMFRTLWQSLCLTIATLAGLAAAPAFGESMESRLLRAIQSGGASQTVSVDEARALMRDPAASGYLGYSLASGMLFARGVGRQPAEWPADRILDKVLGELHPGLTFESPADLPDRFGAEDLVFTLVYALVIGGGTQSAIDVLERHLANAPEYKRAVVLQGLTNIGVPRAKTLVQQEASRPGDRNLAENMLVDLHYPFLDELRARWSLISPDERVRSRLTTLASGGCAERPTLAIYLLGFMERSEDKREERAELELLRRLARLDCHWARYFAVRSLALRSEESIGFWDSLYRRERDGWQKAQLARIGFARFGHAFVPTALEWLRTEPTQYVQWELAHGVLESARGVVLRDHWDIWQPTTLQFRLLHSPQRSRSGEFNHAAMFVWLEAGNRPGNDAVRNHVLYGIAKDAMGTDTRRLLRMIAAIEPISGARPWWILQPLRDGAALPLLRYWEGLEKDAPSLSLARRIIGDLENAGDATVQSTRDSACCRPTKACLVAQVRASHADPDGSPITTPEQAEAWLSRRATPSPDVQITFPGFAGRRVADISVTDKPDERWEHRLDCWRPAERHYAPIQ